MAAVALIGGEFALGAAEGLLATEGAAAIGAEAAGSGIMEGIAETIYEGLNNPAVQQLGGMILDNIVSGYDPSSSGQAPNPHYQANKKRKCEDGGTCCKECSDKEKKPRKKYSCKEKCDWKEKMKVQCKGCSNYFRSTRRKKCYPIKRKTKKYTYAKRRYIYMYDSTGKKRKMYKNAYGGYSAPKSQWPKPPSACEMKKYGQY